MEGNPEKNRVALRHNMEEVPSLLQLLGYCLTHSFLLVLLPHQSLARLLRECCSRNGGIRNSTSFIPSVGSGGSGLCL